MIEAYVHVNPPVELLLTFPKPPPPPNSRFEGAEAVEARGGVRGGVTVTHLHHEQKAWWGWERCTRK